MKIFISGTVLAIIASFVSPYLFGTAYAYFLPGGIGLASILISAVFSGSMLSGDRIRANFLTESKDDRRERQRTMTQFALFGLPNLLGAVLLYTLFH
ncbi:DUF5316 domain-containing protein [Bacillus sp. B-jedd]|uniref:DUF5316 domain-containing protein n=1 Tax=Bacillus sp. B-jedd TaxID=1476857 RepID=UPI0005155E5D|nr:DUF5316 domain-containing protein [Bacillus sp. B-jedd]CEG27060.1 hypothetical protein BN1002_01916 [Bacillus sp. B-jedd]